MMRVAITRLFIGNIPVILDRGVECSVPICVVYIRS